ncbi:MAG: hypothetical protein ACKO6B_03790 [Planctomycetia bacterium]
MTRRLIFAGFVACVLVAVPPAGARMLRGEDDTVVDAATLRAREQPQQHQQIVLDEQMNGMLFQHDGTPEKSRELALGRLMLEVAALEDAVGLTDGQRRKCAAAARLDVARTMDEIETVRRRYAGRTIDLQNQAGQAEWSRFNQDVQAVQTKLQDLAGDTSLLRRVIAGMLDDEQRTVWQRESDLRSRYQWASVVDAGLMQLDVAIGLTAAQYDAIRGLLLEKPLRINQAKVWQHGNHFPPFVCRYGLAQLDQARLKSLVNERQWKTLNQFIEQGRGMAQHLKQQKMILD